MNDIVKNIIKTGIFLNNYSSKHSVHLKGDVLLWDEDEVVSELLHQSVVVDFSGSVLGLGLSSIFGLSGSNISVGLRLVRNLIGDNLGGNLLSSEESNISLVVLKLHESGWWSLGPLGSGEVWVLVDLVDDLINSSLGNVILEGIALLGGLGVGSSDSGIRLSLERKLVGNNSSSGSLTWNEGSVGVTEWSSWLGRSTLLLSKGLVVVVVSGRNGTEKGNKNCIFHLKKLL